MAKILYYVDPFLKFCLDMDNGCPYLDNSLQKKSKIAIFSDDPFFIFQKMSSFLFLQEMWCIVSIFYPVTRFFWKKCVHALLPLFKCKPYPFFCPKLAYFDYFRLTPFYFSLKWKIRYCFGELVHFCVKFCPELDFFKNNQYKRFCGLLKSGNIPFFFKFSHFFTYFYLQNI